MIIQAADAIGLTLSSGLEGARNPNLPTGPMIVMDFPPLIGHLLAQRVLPRAKPENAFVGRYLHEDKKITLGCYVVVTATDDLGETRFIIGNECDFPEDSWNPFWERFGEFGHFTISCGVHMDDRRSILTNPTWFLPVEKFYHEDIRPLVYRAAGLPI